MSSYSYNPENELRYLEIYKGILELEIERIRNEIRYIEGKLKLMNEMYREFGRTGAMEQSYFQNLPPPSGPIPPYRRYGVPTPSPMQPYPQQIGGKLIPPTGKLVVAIASQDDKGLDSLVSPIFARAPFFTIVEIENKEVKRSDVIPNQFSYYGGGAGMAVAQWLVSLGINAVIAGNFGPNSIGILEQMGIRTISYPSMQIREAVKKLIE